MITLQPEFAAIEAVVRNAAAEASKLESKRDSLELVELSLADLDHVGGGAFIFQW